MEEQPEAPKPLRDRPELFEDLYPIWEAFWFLHPSRQIGMDVGAIALQDIISYWKMVGVEGRSELMERVALVRAMDNTFLEYARNKH